MVLVAKNLPTNAGDAGSILGQEDPLEEGMAPHSIFLTAEPHGQRSLVGYSSRGCKELDVTKVTWHTCPDCVHGCFQS